MKYNCPHCQKPLVIDDREVKAGKKFRCGNCSQVFDAPKVAATPQEILADTVRKLDNQFEKRPNPFACRNEKATANISSPATAKTPRWHRKIKELSIVSVAIAVIMFVLFAVSFSVNLNLYFSVDNNAPDAVVALVKTHAENMCVYSAIGIVVSFGLATFAHFIGVHVDVSKQKIAGAEQTNHLLEKVVLLLRKSKL